MALDFFSSSLILSAIKHLFRLYICAEDRVDAIYKESKLCALIVGLWKGLKFCFKYSLLGKITEIGRYKDSAVINESGFLSFFKQNYIKYKGRSVDYLYSSVVLAALKKNLNKYSIPPLKTLSIIIILITGCNIALKLLLNETIGLLEWLVQAAFLFGCIAGLFSNAKWDEIKKTSFILRSLRNI